MILYGSSFSPFVRKVLVYATEKGIALSNVQIERPTMQPDFLRASPMKKMPALVDGDFMISDSSAIIAYLECKNPQPPMYPSDAVARARSIWFEEFADTIMSAVVFKAFFNRIVAPKFMKQPGNEALAIEGETKDLPPVLDYLETVAPVAGDFLVANTLGVADISVATMFVNYGHAKISIDAKKYPKTMSWVASMLSRPSFSEIVAKEKKILLGL
jgi:glutathione S-transferase